MEIKEKPVIIANLDMQVLPSQPTTLQGDDVA